MIIKNESGQNVDTARKPLKFFTGKNINFRHKKTR